MAKDWNDLIKKAMIEGDLTSFYNSVSNLARRVRGIDFDDKDDFAQSVCLAMHGKKYLDYLYKKLDEEIPVEVYIRMFIRWRRGDWYRKIERIEFKSLEDTSENEIFSIQKNNMKENSSNDGFSNFIEDIVPRINNERNLRSDAKENTIKVFLLSQIFLGKLFEYYYLTEVVEMIKVDLSIYEIQNEEIGQLTIEETAVRLEISTTAVTNAISRIREISKSLAKELDFPCSINSKMQGSRLDALPEKDDDRS